MNESHTSNRPYDDIPLMADGSGFGPTLEFGRHRFDFMKRFADAPPLCRFQLLDRKVTLVTGASEVQQILLDHASVMVKSSIQRFAAYPLLGEGLLASSGDLWKRQRKLMAPIFTPAQIASYGQAMMACAQREMDSFPDEQDLDICASMTRITMSVAGKTLFGAETFSEADKIGNAISVAIRIIGKQFSSPLTPVQIGLRTALSKMAPHMPGPLAAAFERGANRLESPVIFGADGKSLDEAVAVLDDYVANLIHQRRNRKTTDDAPDLLTRLLEAHDDNGRMTDKQLRDEILNLFVAGHETTAVSLSWSLYLLARHPDVLAQVQNEVDALPNEPTTSDLPKLGLVLRVFKEALRLYPPLPLYSRDNTEDIVVNGYEIPRGTPILISPYGTHHRADLWPDPERFDPDRFLPQAEAARHRYAYIPFSAGPRICIGNHFALMEATLVLTTLLRNYEFSFDGEKQVIPEIDSALRPDALVMKVRRRKPENRVAA